MSFHEDCRQTSLDDAFTEWMIEGVVSYDAVLKQAPKLGRQIAYKQNQYVLRPMQKLSKKA